MVDKALRPPSPSSRTRTSSCSFHESHTFCAKRAPSSSGAGLLGASPPSGRHAGGGAEAARVGVPSGGAIQLPWPRQERVSLSRGLQRKLLPWVLSALCSRIGAGETQGKPAFQGCLRPDLHRTKADPALCNEKCSRSQSTRDLYIHKTVDFMCINYRCKIHLCQGRK